MGNTLSLYPQQQSRPVSSRPMGNTLSLSHVRTVPCFVGWGLCVSFKHGLVIVSGHFDRLHMYSLTDGSLVRRVGHWGSGKGQFKFGFGGLCVGPGGDSVLVAESGNDRVQEVRVVDGSWVRFLGEGVLREPQFVDCNADVIAVSENCHRISVLSWADGSVRAQFGSYGSGPGRLYGPHGVRLLGDGSEVVVADQGNNRLCVFRLNGEFVQSLGSREQGLNGPIDVLECASDGSFIVANFGAANLVKVSTAGDALDTYDEEVRADGTFATPAALTMLPDGGLVVLETQRVRVFRTLVLRHAWISACVIRVNSDARMSVSHN
jgi:hypothetical protein